MEDLSRLSSFLHFPGIFDRQTDVNVDEYVAS